MTKDQVLKLIREINALARIIGMSMAVRVILLRFRIDPDRKPWALLRKH